MLYGPSLNSSVRLSVSLSAYLPACLLCVCICLSVCQSVCLSVCQSFCLSVLCACMPVSLSVHQPIRSSVCRFICPLSPVVSGTGCIPSMEGRRLSQRQLWESSFSGSAGKYVHTRTVLHYNLCSHCITYKG